MNTNHYILAGSLGAMACFCISCAGPQPTASYPSQSYSPPQFNYTPPRPPSAVVPRSPVEAVALLKVMDSNCRAIIQRRNGEMYLIEYGVGVISIWRYEGKAVLINSPGLFCGVGSSIILPDADQKARIWNAEEIQQ